ncbi:hypothetical protein LTR95_013771, partial [Oleoguttula sp. CCFEE 5521]
RLPRWCLDRDVDKALKLNNSNHGPALYMLATTTLPEWPPLRDDMRIASLLNQTHPAPNLRRVPSDDLDPLGSDANGEHIPATLNGVVRQLSVLQRQMEYNFRNLHDGLRNTNIRLDEQRADTNRRFDEQRAETNKRFDDTNRRFDEQGGQFGQLKAQQINRSATRINNLIQPVGRNDGTPIPTELSRRYKYVHEFLRLKRPENWQVLAELHGFYGSESWSTWGFNPMSSWDESDTEEPLMTHNTLEYAISWAPDDALQELARHLGLDYEKITTNVEEYESLQQRRATQHKRVTAGESTSSKRGKLSIPERQEVHTRKKDKVKQPVSTDSLSGVLEWDTRATEKQTPESQRPRVKDAQYRQPTLSPTSVATSVDQLPTRTKR